MIKLSLLVLNAELYKILRLIEPAVVPLDEKIVTAPMETGPSLSRRAKKALQMLFCSSSRTG
ncbi:MAG: hypothetical protein Hyperionvirus36_12 [Hyperionvirus sp.]|uniref:Uncharacterized protein n=1 Tax=Hyperionvirus sp. TaxID=2487770 RepID=A0A3G5ABY8_9VIRU|nr:MAG: hypothetical protein Hyperionvirus36_12 [Hyperionvirus sp.]